MPYEEDVFAILEMLAQGAVCKDRGSMQQSGELGRLAGMLDEAGIPFKRSSRQLVYYGHSGAPVPKAGEFFGMGWGAIVSVISDGYGSKEGLLEANGLCWNAKGHLTAKEVFEGISHHWEGEA